MNEKQYKEERKARETALETVSLFAKLSGKDVRRVYEDFIPPFCGCGHCISGILFKDLSGKNFEPFEFGGMKFVIINNK